MANIQNNDKKSHDEVSMRKSRKEKCEKNIVSQPIELLLKVLVEKTMKEKPNQRGIITRNVFINKVFPQYPSIGDRIFNLLLIKSGNSPLQNIITQENFEIQANKILSLKTDENLSLFYLSMYSADGNKINENDFKFFLLDVYKNLTDCYSEEKKLCDNLSDTIQIVINGAFRKHSTMTVENLAHWINKNCCNLMSFMHCSIVSTFAIAYRNNSEFDEINVIKLLRSIFSNESYFPEEEKSLPLSQVWILSSTLSDLYTSPPLGIFFSTITRKVIDMPLPSHWRLIYNSEVHGFNSKTFLNYVLTYCGPTLTFLEADNNKFCLAIDQEWHESCCLWGNEDCFIIQTLPSYQVIEKGKNIIYLNYSIKKYPYGIRIGKNRKDPFLVINQGFDNVILSSGVTLKLNSVKVYGVCTKYDIWQVSSILNFRRRTMKLQEAERHKILKMRSIYSLYSPENISLH